MTSIKDGGPAFPQKEPLTSDWEGMSLRDWFAGQALSGLMANGLGESAAPRAYKMADAMIAARSAI